MSAFFKRRINAATSTWDEEVKDSKLRAMLEETLKKVNCSNPARGRWDVKGEQALLWVDASSLALVAALEVNGNIIEDVCWLRRDECSHINLAELDAVIKGLNLAIAWKMKKLTLLTDSRTVYHWTQDTLSRKARVKTKASSEMLIRRRLETLRTIVEEYNLEMDVKFVPSTENKADLLTRVPKKWLNSEREHLVCGAADTVTPEEVNNIHETCGHPGIRRTLYFCKRLYPSVQRHQVRDVVQKC